MKEFFKSSKQKRSEKIAKMKEKIAAEIEKINAAIRRRASEKEKEAPLAEGKLKKVLSQKDIDMIKNTSAGMFSLNEKMILSINEKLKKDKELLKGEKNATKIRALNDEILSGTEKLNKALNYNPSSIKKALAIKSILVKLVLPLKLDRDRNYSEVFREKGLKEGLKTQDQWKEFLSKKEGLELVKKGLELDIEIMKNQKDLFKAAIYVADVEIDEKTENYINAEAEGYDSGISTLKEQLKSVNSAIEENDSEKVKVLINSNNVQDLIDSYADSSAIAGELESTKPQAKESSESETEAEENFELASEEIEEGSDINAFVIGEEETEAESELEEPTEPVPPTPPVRDDDVDSDDEEEQELPSKTFQPNTSTNSSAPKSLLTGFHDQVRNSEELRKQQKEEAARTKQSEVPEDTTVKPGS